MMSRRHACLYRKAIADTFKRVAVWADDDLWFIECNAAAEPRAQAAELEQDAPDAYSDEVGSASTERPGCPHDPPLSTLYDSPSTLPQSQNDAYRAIEEAEPRNGDCGSLHICIAL